MAQQPEALWAAIERYAAATAGNQAGLCPAEVLEDSKNALRAQVERLQAERGQVVESWRLERQRHIANEWADMATSALQWLRNIVDGISTPVEALENTEGALKHCRKVNDAPGLYGQDAPPAVAQAGGADERAALAALFKDAMDWGRSYGQRLNLGGITVADVSEGYADKARAALAAQPTRMAVGSISLAHLKSQPANPWCKEILFYSPDNTGYSPSNRVMLYADADLIASAKEPRS